ncbi:MAG TPA: hypothetical protein DCW68_03175 [Rhodospirillaceae bacterium]|nr:MAG: hypothetical protein A2018_06150 [Alphaproteobacteria bacterium GWF2_58_20]HAU29094.1 hypothetical protein [Rhodospirillaceae bacterium]
MSLFGSLFTGVSALSAQSQSLSMISNNIANVNTTAYKRNEASFSSLVTDSGRTSTFSPGGVLTGLQGTVGQQGLLQQTNSTTDIGISGNGFFSVKRDIGATDEPLWTRAGSFTEDSRGYLKNSAGFYLMGWTVDSNGNIPSANADISSLEPVNVAFLGGLTRPTSTMDISINLDSRQVDTAAGPHFTRAVRVYDNMGEGHDLTFEFTRSAPLPATDWDMVIRHPDGSVISTTAVTFDGNGSVSVPAAGADGRVVVTQAGVDWGNGSAIQNIDIDITDFSQYAGEYNVVYVNQNGAELGLRTGINVNSDGQVIATFSNGMTTTLYQLAVGTFTNPNGLEQLSGNAFRQSMESGDYNLRLPGDGGAGQIAASSLEASNVDLAEEFSKMIITQRAYSAGTKVITTSDQMLQELLNIR